MSGGKIISDADSALETLKMSAENEIDSAVLENDLNTLSISSVEDNIDNIKEEKDKK